MARVARKIDAGKIRRLREFLADPTYIDNAVETLAGRMTERILDQDGSDSSPVGYRLANSSRSAIADLLILREKFPS